MPLGRTLRNCVTFWALALFSRLNNMLLSPILSSLIISHPACQLKKGKCNGNWKVPSKSVAFGSHPMDHLFFFGLGSEVPWTPIQSGRLVHFKSLVESCHPQQTWSSTKDFIPENPHWSTTLTNLYSSTFYTPHPTHIPKPPHTPKPTPPPSTQPHTQRIHAGLVNSIRALCGLWVVGEEV